ncbi:MAG TPA: hypothetical protein DCL15_19035 [Chloroflexi bacterium]|nr:hypothetical protein [Chloroflexota bacterium]HHW87486.1 hypothetical protein [Chloroflexota bacterium]
MSGVIFVTLIHRQRHLIALLFGLSLALAPLAAYADAVIGTGTPASCQTAQAATDLSNAVAAGGVISFNCGPAPVTIMANTNATDKTVVVNGGGLVTLSGDNLRQLFFVFGTGKLTLNNVTLIDGDAPQGGALYVDTQAQATINGSFITSNNANDGGGVYNRGTLTINYTTLGSNIASGNGGGVYNNGGTVNITDSYLISNQAQNGGAIFTSGGQLTLLRSAVRSSVISNFGGGVYAAGPTTITNVTFSNNRAVRGGGLYTVANTAVLNATFNENRADLGGAIYHQAATTTVKNTILTGSLDTAGASPSLNCDGPTLTTQGRNIVGDNSCVPNPSSVGDLLATDAQLGVWLGSPLRGYIPAESSPAVDYAQACPATDQRGYPRPLGADCDVGAIERGVLLFLPLTQR